MFSIHLSTIKIMMYVYDEMVFIYEKVFWKSV